MWTLKWWRAYQAEQARQQRVAQLRRLFRESDGDLQRFTDDLTALYADECLQTHSIVNDTRQEGGEG